MEVVSPMIPGISTYSTADINILALGAAAQNTKQADQLLSSNPSEECETCSNRKYQDRSSDPSVSFQTPTQVDPQNAEAAIWSHEREHVTHETQKAEREGQEVVSVHVDIRHGICPECGKIYVEGGETTVVTRPETDADSKSGSPSQKAAPIPMFSNGVVNLLV